MSAVMPECTPLSYWQQTHNVHIQSATTTEINLHDTITREQRKRQAETGLPSEKEEKSRKVKKVTFEKQRNNIKDERKTEKMTFEYRRKQQDPAVPSEHFLDTNTQRSKLSEEQEKEKQQANWHSGEQSSPQEELNPTQRSLLDRIPFSERDNWARLIDAVNRNTDAGIVEANRKTRQRYWTHWVDFLLCGFDPYLQNLDGKQQLAELQAFAQRAREGTFRRGKRV